MSGKVFKICLAVIAVIASLWGGNLLLTKRLPIRVSIVVNMPDSRSANGEAGMEFRQQYTHDDQQARAHQLAHFLRSDAISGVVNSQDNEGPWFDARVIAGTSYVELIAEAEEEQDAFGILDQVTKTYSETVAKSHIKSRGSLIRQLREIYQKKLSQLESLQNDQAERKDWKEQGVELKYVSLLRSQIELKLRIYRQERLLLFLENFKQGENLVELHGISDRLDQLLGEMANATIEAEVARVRYGERHSSYLAARRREHALEVSVVEMLPSARERLEQDLLLLKKELVRQETEMTSLEQQSLNDRNSVVGQRVMLARQDALGRNLADIETRLQELEEDAGVEQMEVVSSARVDRVAPKREKQATLIACGTGLFCLLWAIFRHKS